MGEGDGQRTIRPQVSSGRGKRLPVLCPEPLKHHPLGKLHP